MGLIPKTYTGTGADLTGNSGDSNRVLTLPNNYLTVQQGLLVYVDSNALAEGSQYTISHKSSGTQITFLIKVWDDQPIIVRYFEHSSGAFYETMRSDFQEILGDFGEEVTLIKSTEIKDSLGNVTSITETQYNIIIFINDTGKNERELADMGISVKGTAKAYFYHEYPDAITGNGDVEVETGDYIIDSKLIKWRVIKILSDPAETSNSIYKIGILKKIDNVNS